MKVMTLHKFYDDDIEGVNTISKGEMREIRLYELDTKSIILNKNDVIALAKEFNLVVYEKDSAL